jgi:hypothetical protein
VRCFHLAPWVPQNNAPYAPGLVRAEVIMRGMEALTEESRGYKEYILIRSLGLKAWFTMATSRAGVTDPLERCAVGKALAEPAGEYNIYRRILEHAPKAAEGDWAGFADGLAADVRAVRDALTEETKKTTKVGPYKFNPVDI